MKYERLTERIGKSICIKETSTNDNKSIWNAIERLAELEDDLEGGKMIRLPCKVGDDAYFVVKHEEDWLIEIGYVMAISIDKNGIWISCRYSSGFSYWHHCKDKKLFFNCAEAEAKLKELKGEV